MRRVILLAFLLTSAAAQAQVWEKYLAPGLTYRMELDPELPRTIHALHFDPKSDAVKLVPELARSTVYDDTKFRGRATVSEIVKREGAIAGANASYFPPTGRPVGLLVRDGELITSPYKNRAEFGWGPNQYAKMATSTFAASFQAAGSELVEIDSVNEEAKPDSISLDTDMAGWAFAKSMPGVCAVLRTPDDKLLPDGKLEAEVMEIKRDVTKLEVRKGEAVLMGVGSKAEAVAALHEGDRVTIAVKVGGFDWDKVQNAVCGGPFLLRDGSAVLDWQEEGFTPAFSNYRYARTAIGTDARGGIWVVSVDGSLRQSVGASLEEMAAIMLRLGCRDAINLDGGGSTDQNGYGVVLNRPADGVERELADAIVFLGSSPQKNSGELHLHNPDRLTIGDNAEISVVGSDGIRIPDSEILWSATGGGWIDQGGMLHADRTDPIALAAFVHGHILTATIPVADSGK